MNGFGALTEITGGGVTVRFPKITHKVTRKVTCPGCDKKRTISRTEFATINPFNKNPDGTQKNATQIRAGLVEKLDAWEPEGRDLYHNKCWENK